MAFYKYLTTSLILFLFTTVLTFANCEFKTESPYNENIKYTGRIDSSDSEKVVFAFPAVKISTGFSGGEIGVVLEDLPYGKESNFITVLIDDQEPQVVSLKPQKSTYTFSPKVKKDIHTISIIKRTESQVGKVAFYGFKLDKDQNLMPVELPEKTIEFIGNSITCGYGNEVSIPAPPKGNPTTGFTTKNENAYMSYASITARNLNANAVLTSYSGKGMFRNFHADTTKTLPKLYSLILPDETDGPKFNPSSFSPDLVVINLGTNDYYMESENKPMSDSVFVARYKQFVSRLMTYYPQADFLCVIGPMTTDSWPEGKRWLSRIGEGIKEVESYFSEKNSEKRVYSMVFTPQSAPYGEDWHPALHTHKEMAKKLTAFIEENIW